MANLKKRAKKAKLSKTARRNLRDQDPTTNLTWSKNKFQCFICFDKDISLLEFLALKHEELKIAMCDSCAKCHINEETEEWHDDKYWNEFDENGKCLYCTICGEGGTLMACDNEDCSKSYCLECLKKWIGEETVEAYCDNSEMKFCCFVCFDEGKFVEEDRGGGSTMDADENEDKPNPTDIYKNFKKFQKATKSYLNQKDKIDDYDNDQKLNESLKSISKSKKYLCYCCFSFVNFNKNSIPSFHPDPDMPVVYCPDCLEYLDFDGDHDRYDFCYLTGEGGELVPCDKEKCKKAFNINIFEKWNGFKKADEMLNNENSEFICFFCDPSRSRAEKFIKQSKDVKEAFLLGDNDVEFTYDIEKEKSKKRSYLSGKKRKRVLNNTSTASVRSSSRRKLSTNTTRSERSSRRRSDRNKYAYESESSEDEEIEKRVTREKPTEGDSKYAEKDTSDFSDTDDDDKVLDQNRNRVNDEPFTEEEARKYLYRHLTRVNKRVKSSDAYHELLGFVK